MILFTLFNGLSAIAPNYESMLVIRFLSGLPHGAFFGVGTVVAAKMAGKGKRSVLYIDDVHRAYRSQFGNGTSGNVYRAHFPLETIFCHCSGNWGICPVVFKTLASCYGS